MAKQNRNTLKNYFKRGSLPSENHFSDLVDSSLNIIDEGFYKTVDDGLKVSTAGASDRLLSFYRNTDQIMPLWTVDIHKPDNRLKICRQGDKVVCSVDASGRVGINKDKAEHTLDVNGVVSSKGRIGGLSGKVRADGRWHSISDELEGCHALEIMAGAGKRGTGKYSLLHAIALNTFNPKGWFFNIFNRKNKISEHHAYYRSKCDKLRLRWKCAERPHHFFLEIKTGCDYGDGIMIQYNLTELWFDHLMEGSWRDEKG